MDAIFEHLTDAQREAVLHVDGPLLILAGPGSGKTRVVTHRVAHLLQQGIAPHQIVALTFTNKAAQEMRDRVEVLAPNQSVWMGTFHRFCAMLLRRYASMIGLGENYSILDASDAKQAMKRAIEAAGVSTTHVSPEQIAASISRAKNRLMTPEMLDGQFARPRDAVAARVYPVYQEQLMTANSVDFDDLLFYAARLLRENPELRSQLDERFRYILVDEYQDTNLAQYAIVRALSVDHPNLAVTGDPDQSIYGWRGADLNNILDFEKDYPNVKTVRLEQNYRSTPNILRVADHLIRHNRRRKAKDLFTDNQEGEPVVLRWFADGFDEADSIADEIVSLIASGAYRASDFAIFCRINALTRSLEHAFRNRRLPYQIVNGLEFYQRKEIKDLLAYLNLINNPQNDVAFMRAVNTPARGIGAKTIQRIREFAESERISMLEAARQAEKISGMAKRSVTMVRRFVTLYDHLCLKATAPLEDLLRYLVEETKYEEYLDRIDSEQQDVDRKANVAEFITAAVEFDHYHPDDGSLEGFLEQIALVSDSDGFETTQDRVTLMTLHAAKGLEFPCVYIIGVEEKMIPHRRSMDNADELEEERRLLFVGITRAKERLQLSCCHLRWVRGDVEHPTASRFLGELPLNEMRQLEEAKRVREFFDQEDDIDQSYPESWDLDVHDQTNDRGDETEAVDAEPDHEHDDQKDADDTADAYDADDTGERPSATKKDAKPSIRSGLKTGAELLASRTVPLNAFRPGIRVRHQEHGEGVVEEVNGRGPKRVARIKFSDGQHSFRLAFAQLELIE